MYRGLVLVALGTLAVPQLAGAVAACPDRTPASIAVADPASRKCQQAIAKAGEKYLKSQTKILAKCKTKQPAGSCPTADDRVKLDKTAASGAKTITSACATDSVQAGLPSSYASLADDTVISSCMLSQHSVAGELVVAYSHGVTTEPVPGTGVCVSGARTGLLCTQDSAAASGNTGCGAGAVCPGCCQGLGEGQKERATCVKEVGKQGLKFFQGAMKAAEKCLAGQSKLGTAGNLSPICVGSFSGGAYVAPTDVKTSEAFAKLISKTDLSISKKCDPAAALGEIDSIFACPGSSSSADLATCLECTGMNGMMDAVVQQYAEDATFVANGPGAIQAAVSAASEGDKLLIASGEYEEEVTVTTDELQIVGCGAATDDRPRIIPPTPQMIGRGFTATGVDGLVFQSLDFFNQNSDHIFVGQAEGVTFRDITGDGNRNTAYAVFPVVSNNVLVELCKVRGQDDAPIYIGQSSGIIARFNEVREGVAGIEIENCGNAQVYGNYGTGNTAGLMVFKDNDLPVQLSDCHHVHHNLFENNNEENFGTGTVAGVPTGTGILMISTDSSVFSHNILRNNNTTGITFTTQDLAGFTPPSEQIIEDNFLFHNWLANNGTSPDPARWPLPFGADVVFLPSSFTLTSSGNCELDNTFGTEIGYAGFAISPNTGECVLPPPAFLPGCPAPPIGGSPSPAFVDGPEGL